MRGSGDRVGGVDIRPPLRTGSCSSGGGWEHGSQVHQIRPVTPRQATLDHLLFRSFLDLNCQFDSDRNRRECTRIFYSSKIHVPGLDRGTFLDGKPSKDCTFTRSQSNITTCSTNPVSWSAACVCAAASVLTTVALRDDVNVANGHQEAVAGKGWYGPICFESTVWGGEAGVE